MSDDTTSFSQKMIDILNGGAVNASMAIGYRTRLFDVMDELGGARTPSEIGREAGLSPRYVREWLGVMATAGVVTVTRGPDGESRYHLPTAHADLLTRRAGNANLGVYTQEIPLLVQAAMERVIDGFHSGEGVAYDHYPRFQAFMGELADAKHRRVLVADFLPSVDGGTLVHRLEQGIRVCDLGCAEGVALRLMARAFPRSTFVGMDISREAIETARSAAENEGLSNVRFRLVDAGRVAGQPEYGGRFDYVTAFDAIHDQTRPLDALKGVHHMLAPGGLFSMVDIAARSEVADNLDHPMGPFLYTVSLLHCMPVGLVSGGSGLGMMWGRETAVAMLHQAGFDDVTVLEIPGDAFNLHFMCRR